MPTALTLLALLSCSSDPLQEDVVHYEMEMRSVLVRNRTLADGFTDAASRIGKGATDPGPIVEQLSKNVVPLADALETEVKAISPQTPELRTQHAVLVDAWSVRAAAYRGLAAAWTAGDLTAWDLARKKGADAKLTEEKYFTAVNALARPYGVVIDQFP